MNNLNHMKHQRTLKIYFNKKMKDKRKNKIRDLIEDIEVDSVNLQNIKLFTGKKENQKKLKFKENKKKF